MVRAAQDLGDADHALLDSEGAHKVAADRELDMLLRWAAAAHDFSESPGLPSRITAGDCIRLVEDVATAYPALVAVPRLSERLEVYDAHWHLVQLLFDAYWNSNTEAGTAGTSPSWTRLRDLIAGRSHIGAFGL